MPQTMKIKDIAEYLDIPLRTLYRMVDNGSFSVPCIPGTKPKRWNADDVARWLGGENVKTCTDCQRTKIITEFPKKRDKFLNICKECVNEKQREYRNKKRNHRLKKYSQDQETPVGRAKKILYSVRERCRKNNIDCELDVDFLTDKIENGICERSGIAFDLTKAVGTFHNAFSPSVDRIDPFKGYLKSNVQIVCSMYNRGKGQHTDDEFLFLCKSVVQFAEEN